MSIATLLQQSSATLPSVGTRLLADVPTQAVSFPQPNDGYTGGVTKIALNEESVASDSASVMNKATTSDSDTKDEQSQVTANLASEELNRQHYAANSIAAMKSSYLMYPPDALGTTRYPHFMMIYINVNSKSALLSGPNALATTDLTGLDNTGSATIGKGITAAKNGTVSDINPSASDISGTIKRTASATAQGLVKASAAAIDGIVGDEWVASHKRLAQAIALPMPNDVSFTYAAEYGQLSMGGLVGSLFSDLASGKSLETAVDNIGNNLMQSAPGASIKAAVGVIGGVVGGVVGAAAQKGGMYGGKSAGVGAGLGLGAAVSAENINAIINKAKGQAVNERLEQVFKQMQFRNFTFNYTFAPRSQNESQVIQDIINKLRLHMHPEVAGAASQGKSNFLIMPDEFDIEFRFADPEDKAMGDTKNRFVQKIKTCALAGLTVNNTPLGQWSAFVDGAPTVIALQLHFIELQPLTREDIQTEMS